MINGRVNAGNKRIPLLENAPRFDSERDIPSLSEALPPITALEAREIHQALHTHFGTLSTPPHAVAIHGSTFPIGTAVDGRRLAVIDGSAFIQEYVKPADRHKNHYAPETTSVHYFYEKPDNSGNYKKHVWKLMDGAIPDNASQYPPFH